MGWLAMKACNCSGVMPSVPGKTTLDVVEKPAPSATMTETGVCSATLIMPGASFISNSKVPMAASNWSSITPVAGSMLNSVRQNSELGPTLAEELGVKARVVCVSGPVKKQSPALKVVPVKGTKAPVARS